jgi:integrase
MSALRRFVDGGSKDAARHSSRSGAWCDIARRISIPGLHISPSVVTLAKDALTSHEWARQAEKTGNRSLMAVYKQPKSKYWWYKFTWNGEPIRQSTKQSNKRVAEQMEAAHRTALAKGEVGIRDKKPVPPLKDFAEQDFLPFVRSTFSAKEKTLKYYEYGVKSLLAFEKLAGARLDAITTEAIGAFIASRKEAGVQISSINRELQSLRRMFHLAEEWGKVERALPTVRMVPGENHRERVLTAEEEALYFAGAKSDAMHLHVDSSLLSDVATILLDCGLRPEECFRLRMENVRDGKIEIPYGKTDNARRRIPMTPRVQAILDMRLSKAAGSQWVFPAPTKSGHMESSTLKKQHAKAIQEARRSSASRPNATSTRYGTPA